MAPLKSPAGSLVKWGCLHRVSDGADLGGNGGTLSPCGVESSCALDAGRACGQECPKRSSGDDPPCSSRQVVPRQRPAVGAVSQPAGAGPQGHTCLRGSLLRKEDSDLGKPGSDWDKLLNLGAEHSEAAGTDGTSQRVSRECGWPDGLSLGVALSLGIWAYGSFFVCCLVGINKAVLCACLPYCYAAFWQTEWEVSLSTEDDAKTSRGPRAQLGGAGGVGNQPGLLRCLQPVLSLCLGGPGPGQPCRVNSHAQGPRLGVK